MLRPKNVKFKKNRKGSLRLSPKNFFLLTRFKEGTVALEATQFARITAKQLESCRQSINKKLKRTGKLYVRVFPDVVVTSKPTEVRMGKGKGSFSFWAVKLIPGRLLFEISGASREIAITALTAGIHKLPVRVKVSFI
jgi:large subunit ribosomal protein L16